MTVALLAGFLAFLVIQDARGRVSIKMGQKSLSNVIEGNATVAEVLPDEVVKELFSTVTDAGMIYMGFWTDPNSSALKVTYHATRSADSMTVTPEVPYLDIEAKGGPVCGIYYHDRVFDAAPLELTVKVNNDTSHVLYLTQTIANVDRSVLDNTPIIVFHEEFHNVNHLYIENFGWGPVNNPSLSFRVEDAKSYSGPHPASYYVDNTPNHIQLTSFNEEINVDIKDAINKSALKAAPLVGVFGVFVFEDAQRKQHALKFQTRVSRTPPGPGAAPPKGMTYDLYLKAGQSNVTATTSVDETFPPKTSGEFALRVLTDRSASFDVAFSFQSTTGEVLPGERTQLRLFQPRIGPSAKLDRMHYIAVSRTLLANVQNGSLVTKIAYNPDNHRHITVHVENAFRSLPEDEKLKTEVGIASTIAKFLKITDKVYLAFYDPSGHFWTSGEISIAWINRAR